MSELEQATPEAARRLTDRIKVAIDGTWQLIQEAYLTRTWAALGYDSWDAYCREEFQGARLRLPREERQEMVASLRESGLSLRAIESATGVSRKTIIKDSREVVESTPPEIAPVLGTDGKSYRSPRAITPVAPAQVKPTDSRPGADKQPLEPRTVTVIHEPDLLAGDDWIEPQVSGDGPTPAPASPPASSALPEEHRRAETIAFPTPLPGEDSPASIAAAAMRDAKTAPSHVFDDKAITHLRDAKIIVAMKGGSADIIADLYAAGVNPDLTMRTWLRVLEETIEWAESFRSDIVANLGAPLRRVQ